jgi:hypothetical protein
MVKYDGSQLFAEVGETTFKNLCTSADTDVSGGNWMQFCQENGMMRINQSLTGPRYFCEKKPVLR